MAKSTLSPQRKILICSLLFFVMFGLGESRSEADSSQQTSGPQTLVPGVRVEQDLASGQTHSYQILLTAGEYLRVVIDQRGIAVTPVMFAPDKSRIADVLFTHAPKGPASLSLIAAVSGTYGLEIQPLAKNAGTGRYELVVAEQRPATTADTFSREEADAIAEFVLGRSLLKATDFQASRAKAVSGELSNYRIVHFATHGLLNSEHPELSGLVLSLVDENGRPQDGFLRMHEIYNLRLPAEVVVLSACQTGLGKEIKGEGLVGLTRGFMYAGAQRVVASLWQVDDLATAELMKRFYRGMLKDNLRPAAALREAQVELMKQKRWSSPYFWAAFVIQGEWR